MTVLAADQSSIGLLGLGVSGLLVAVTVAISTARHLDLNRSVLWACGRALVQLLLVGVALRLVVDDNDPLVRSWLWVAAMVLFASWTVRRRTGGDVLVGALAAAAFTTAAAVSIGVLFGFGVFELSGRTLVPLSGMVVGNSLSATVLVTTRLLAERADNRDHIEARLALGLTSQRAFAPYVRRAVRQALIPQIETTKAVGIVFLPGAMVGLILGGADPADAVRVQLAVMYLVLGSVTTTTSVMAIGLARRLFTADHRLRDLPSGDSLGGSEPSDPPNLLLALWDQVRRSDRARG